MISVGVDVDEMCEIAEIRRTVLMLYTVHQDNNLEVTVVDR